MKTPNAAPRIPADFSKLLEWANPIRRLVSVAPSAGYSVLTIRIVVNAEGKVVQYTEPTVIRLEPRAGVDQLHALLEALTKD